MSTGALLPAPLPPGELAVYERVRQLESLIEQARATSLPGAASAGVPASAAVPATAAGETAPAGGFASALQSASQAYSPVAYSPNAPAGAEGSRGGEYEAQIQAAAQRHGLDPALLHGLIQQESGFDPNAQSSAGASGLTQLMPGTAASLGVANPLDPSEAIEGGARYLSELMGQFGGNVSDALAAYNAGPGAVQQYGGVPPYAETQSYVSKVLGYAQAYRQSHPPASAVGVPA